MKTSLGRSPALSLGTHPSPQVPAHPPSPLSSAHTCPQHAQTFSFIGEVLKETNGSGGWRGEDVGSKTMRIYLYLD